MAHADINELLNTPLGLAFAKKLLKDYGEFYPFGVAMGLDGKIIAVGAGAGDGNDNPPPGELIDLMIVHFKQEAGGGQLRAAAIFYDVLTLPPGQAEKCDAICASLEHQSGEAYDAFAPYKKSESGEF